MSRAVVDAIEYSHLKELTNTIIGEWRGSTLLPRLVLVPDNQYVRHTVNHDMSKGYYNAYVKDVRDVARLIKDDETRTRFSSFFGVYDLAQEGEVSLSSQMSYSASTGSRQLQFLRSPDEPSDYPIVFHLQWYWMYCPSMCGMSYLHSLVMSRFCRHGNGRAMEKELYERPGADFLGHVEQCFLKYVKRVSRAWSYTAVLGTDHLSGHIARVFRRDPTCSNTEPVINRNSTNPVAAFTVNTE